MFTLHLQNHLTLIITEPGSLPNGFRAARHDQKTLTFISRRNSNTQPAPSFPTFNDASTITARKRERPSWELIHVFMNHAASASQHITTYAEHTPITRRIMCLSHNCISPQNPLCSTYQGMLSHQTEESQVGNPKFHFPIRLKAVWFRQKSCSVNLARHLSFIIVFLPKTDTPLS